MNRGRLLRSSYINGPPFRNESVSPVNPGSFIRPRSPASSVADSAGFTPTHHSTPTHRGLEMSSSSGQEQPEFLPLGASSPGGGQRQRFQGRHRFERRRGNLHRFSGVGNTSTPIRNESDGNHAGRFHGSNEKPDRRKPYNQQRGSKGNLDGKDISLYFHPSMLEDPWAELELKLKCQSKKSFSHKLNTSLPVLDCNIDVKKVKEASASPSGSTASDIEIGDCHGLHSPFTSEKDTVTSGSDG